MCGFVLYSRGKVMRLKYSAVSIAVLSVLLTNIAVAADVGPASGVEFDPGRVNAGVFEVMPWVGLKYGRDDNVGSTSAAKTATTFTLLNPNIVIGLPTHGNFYGAKYSGDFRRNSGSVRDDYNDHKFRMLADNTWSARLNSLINLDYVKGHDARNALLFASQEKWHTSGINGKLHYGAEGAQGQFEVTAGQMSKRYDTNNTGATQLYSHDRADFGGTFFYKIAPATQMFVEADHSKFSYVAVASNKYDSTEQRYMMGVKWDATAKTKGSVKFGTVKKSFNLGLTPSGSSAIWDADITWAPKTYSVLDISMHQKAAEYGGTGSFMVSRDTDFSWAHDWSGYVTSALTLGNGSDDFVNSARMDKRSSYGMKLTYGFRRWLRAGVGYEHIRRSSTQAVNNYTKGVTMLTLEGSL